MPPQRQTTWLLALEIVLAVLLPIAGAVIAAALFLTRHPREGVLVLAATLVGAAAGLLVFRLGG